MRPRVFPAEDERWPVLALRAGRDASMRPRVFPAEDPAGRTREDGMMQASMRPRVFPAEDYRANQDSSV